jgi:hypothetical protein
MCVPVCQTPPRSDGHGRELNLTTDVTHRVHPRHHGVLVRVHCDVPAAGQAPVGRADPCGVQV